MKIEHDVELAPRTTLGVGGKAAHYACVESDAELTAALDWASEHQLAVRVLGGGSNLVVADAGFAGLVIDVQLRGIELCSPGDASAGEAEVQVEAAAGEPWDDFVAAMVAQRYQGLECLSGIPGRVGATPIQNVGAYGQDVSETITSVIAFDRLGRTFCTFSAEECRFAYRDSRFKSFEPNRFIVTRVVFRLKRNARPALRYAELERDLERRRITEPSLSEVRETVIRLRRAKSMVLDANDPNGRSCGSFFVNPTLAPDAFEHFLSRAAGEGSVPQFPQSDGRIKLAAAWLIEHAGFARGLRDGNVGLSTRHALALVAHPGARADDVWRLAERIRRGVLERFGVALEPEPVFWD